jgi:hypothetical protein
MDNFMYLYVTAPIDYFAAFMPAEMYYERLTEIDQLGPEAAQAARAYVDHCVELLKGWTNFNDADRANGPFVTALPNAGGTPEGSLIVTLKGQNEDVPSSVELQ